MLSKVKVESVRASGKVYSTDVYDAEAQAIGLRSVRCQIPAAKAGEVLVLKEKLSEGVSLGVLAPGVER